MKAKISLLVVIVAALIASAVAVTNHYNKTNINKQHDNQAVIQAKDEQIRSLTAQRDEYKAHANYNRIECEKGRSNHDLLTPTNKNKAPQPECGAVLP